MRLSVEEKEFMYGLFDQDYHPKAVEGWLEGVHEVGDIGTEELQTAAAIGYLHAVRACMEKDRRRRAAVVAGIIPDEAACLGARQAVAARLREYLAEITYEETCIGIYGCTKEEAELLACIIAYLEGGCG